MPLKLKDKWQIEDKYFQLKEQIKTMSVLFKQGCWQIDKGKDQWPTKKQTRSVLELIY